MVETSQFDLSWGDEALDDLERQIRTMGTGHALLRAADQVTAAGAGARQLDWHSTLVYAAADGLVQEDPQADRAARPDKSRVPEGLWVKCPACAQIIYNKDLAASLNVCTEVRASLPAQRRRAAAHAVRRRLEEHDAGLTSTDPLQFTDTKPYQQRLEGEHRRPPA